MTREQIEAGPRNIWRYKALLPVPDDIEQSPNTEPGFTRLLRADNLGRELGIENLWVKDDSHQPDQLLQGPRRRLRAERRPRARRQGLRLPVDRQPRQRRRRRRRPRRHQDRGVHPEQPRAAQAGQLRGLHRARWSRSNGNYDDVNRLASEIAGEEDGWAFVNVNVRPYYAEGSKTLGYEIAEQLGWRLPDQIVIPVASGSQLTKVRQGVPGADRARPGRGQALQGVRRPGHRLLAGLGRPTRPASTRSARSSRTPSPRAWRSATPPTASTCSTSAGETGGAVEDITDDEVREGIVLLARTEGIFTETAGGTTVGVLKKLVETGQLDPTPRDRRHQHRHGPEDPRRGRRLGRPRGDHRPVVRRLRRHRHRLTAVHRASAPPEEQHP